MDVCGRMLTYLDVRGRAMVVRGRMRSYVGVCGRMWTYADVRRRTWTYVDACGRT